MKTFLKCVTITGADHWVNPAELVALDRDFPFVEWGILVSRKRAGEKRYPAMDWINRLHDLDLQLAAHVCGEWARDFVQGGHLFLQERGYLGSYFRRFQFNIAEIAQIISPPVLLESLGSFPRPVILQVVNIYDNLRPLVGRVQWLFDASGGRGLLGQWPTPITDSGLAGGLTPANVRTQLENIEACVGNHLIWIDVETGVRDEQDHFDLQRVRQFLEAASPFVYGNGNATTRAASLRHAPGSHTPAQEA